VLLRYFLIVISIFCKSVILKTFWARKAVPIIVRHSQIYVAEPTVYFDWELFPGKRNARDFRRFSRIDIQKPHKIDLDFIKSMQITIINVNNRIMMFQQFCEIHN
jgi:hypothetical protein